MKNLKQLRLDKKLSQQQLAEKLNLSQQTIYKYENKITEPDIRTLKKLSAYFNTSIDYLVGNTENPQKPDIYIEAHLNPEELQHIRLYRYLPEEFRCLVDEIMAAYHNKE